MAKKESLIDFKETVLVLAIGAYSGQLLAEIVEIFS